MTQNHEQGSLPFSSGDMNPICLDCERKDRQIKNLEAAVAALNERIRRLFQPFGEIGPPKDH